MAKSKTVTARFPHDAVVALDELRMRKQREAPGDKVVTRTEVLIELVRKSAEAASAITFNPEPPESDEKPTRAKPKK